MLNMYRCGIVVAKQGQPITREWEYSYINKGKMVNFNALTSSVSAPVQKSIDYRSTLFSSFLNENHTVRFNDFFYGVFF